MMGNIIRSTRIRMGLSQNETCEGICDRSLLSRIENNSTSPSVALLLLLCERLHLSPGDVLTGTNVDSEDQLVFIDHLKQLYILGEERKVIELGKDAIRLKWARTSDIFHSQVTTEIGRAYHRLGQYQQAFVFFEQAFEETKSTYQSSVHVDAEHGMATALQDLGLLDRSLRHYESCYSAVTPNDPTLAIKCGYNYSRLLTNLGQTGRAKVMAIDADLLSTKTATYPVGGHLESLLGILYEDTNDVPHAREHFQRAYHFYQFQGDSESASGVMSRLATL